MSRDIFGCHSWGRGVITSTSEGKRSCYTSYNVHDGLLQQSYSAQNVNSAEQKKKKQNPNWSKYSINIFRMSE